MCGGGGGVGWSGCGRGVWWRGGIGVEEGVEWVWRRGGDRCGGGGGVGVEEGWR